MRRRFKPTWLQRRAVRDNIIRLVQPGQVLGVLRRAGIPEDFAPTDADFRLESVHPDRFVLRAALRLHGRVARSYALNVYAADFGEQVWRHCRTVAGHEGSADWALCLPEHYVPEERMLLFPWIEGRFLSDISDERRPDLQRRAARLAAYLHRMPIVPEEETTLRMMLDEVSERCDRLRVNWPQAHPMVAPFPGLLREAATCLDPAPPAFVHGDLATGQFLWTGERLVLLDQDMFGYTDPAYDVGHFLAQQERRCLLDPEVTRYAADWLPSFTDAYLAANPHVSRRNVDFYRGLTFTRKVYTLCRRDPGLAPSEGPILAERARHYLRDVMRSR